jgi:hypothetical protein
MKALKENTNSLRAFLFYVYLRTDLFFVYIASAEDSKNKIMKIVSILKIRI